MDTRSHQVGAEKWTHSERIRAAGIACAIGGGLWVINLMLVVVANDWVHDNIAVFRSWEAVFVVVQVLLLVGVLGLAWSGAVGEGWLGRIGSLNDTGASGTQLPGHDCRTTFATV